MNFFYNHIWKYNFSEDKMLCSYAHEIDIRNRPKSLPQDSIWWKIVTLSICRAIVNHCWCCMGCDILFKSSCSFTRYHYVCTKAVAYRKAGNLEVLMENCIKQSTKGRIGKEKKNSVISPTWQMEVVLGSVCCKLLHSVQLSTLAYYLFVSMFLGSLTCWLKTADKESTPLFLVVCLFVFAPLQVP